MEPAPLEGSYERGNDPSYQKPPSPAGSQLRQTGGFKAHRGVKQLACGRWGRERPAQTLLVTLLHFPRSPRALSAGMCNSWVLKLRPQWTDLERGLSLAVQRQPERPGLRSGLQLEVCPIHSLGPPQEPQCQQAQEGRSVAQPQQSHSTLLTTGLTPPLRALRVKSQLVAPKMEAGLKSELSISNSTAGVGHSFSRHIPEPL